VMGHGNSEFRAAPTISRRPVVKHLRIRYKR
jgi:hypothetical protein